MVTAKILTWSWSPGSFKFLMIQFNPFPTFLNWESRGNHILTLANNLIENANKIRMIQGKYFVFTVKHKQILRIWNLNMINSPWITLSCLCFILDQPPGGSSNLWDLVSVITGQDDSLLPASYSKGVMHMKHLLKFKTVSCSYSLSYSRNFIVCAERKPNNPTHTQIKPLIFCYFMFC